MATVLISPSLDFSVYSILHISLEGSDHRQKSKNLNRFKSTQKGKHLSSNRSSLSLSTNSSKSINPVDCATKKLEFLDISEKKKDSNCNVVLKDQVQYVDLNGKSVNSFLSETVIVSSLRTNGNATIDVNHDMRQTLILGLEDKDRLFGEVSNLGLVNNQIPEKEPFEIVPKIEKIETNVRDCNGLNTKESINSDMDGINIKNLEICEHFVDFDEIIGNFFDKEPVEMMIFLKNDGKLNSVSDFNNLLAACVKKCSYDLTVNLFSEMRLQGYVPDYRSYSIMIRCFCQNSKPDEGKRMLQIMLDCGFHPSVVIFTMLIDSFCKKGKMKLASEIFDIMGRIGCEPTIQTYNCLIKGLCFVGQVEKAIDLMKKIKKSSTKPDIYTFTAVMNGLCKVGRSDEAMELLEDALLMGLKPNVVTFNTLFNGYSREGKPLEGTILIRKMEELDCRPDLISYTTLLHGLLKWNEISEALNVYKKMSKLGLEADEKVMNTLLRGVSKKSFTDTKFLEEAEDLFNGMKKRGFTPSTYTYCLMIQVFSIQGKIDIALTNLKTVIEMGVSPRTMTFNLVIRALCNEGRIEDAFSLLILMVKRNVFGIRTSCNILIECFYRKGRLLEASMVYGMAIKRGISPLRKTRCDSTAKTIDM